MITIQEINRAQLKIMGPSASETIGPFAPPSGYCYSCRRQIYDTDDRKEKALKELVTGCPHCHYSFVE